MSRDPIEEEGGINLYIFCENDALTGVDVLGNITVGSAVNDVKQWLATHANGQGGISHTFPLLRFMIYTPPPVWIEVNFTMAGEIFSCYNLENGFLRGSAGLGAGDQFNIQKKIDSTFTDLSSEWSVHGGKAWGITGISLEAGVSVEFYIVFNL